MASVFANYMELFVLYQCQNVLDIFAFPIGHHDNFANDFAARPFILLSGCTHACSTSIHLIAVQYTVITTTYLNLIPKESAEWAEGQASQTRNGYHLSLR